MRGKRTGSVIHYYYTYTIDIVTLFVNGFDMEKPVLHVSDILKHRSSVVFFCNVAWRTPGFFSLDCGIKSIHILSAVFDRDETMRQRSIIYAYRALPMDRLRRMLSFVSH